MTKTQENKDESAQAKERKKKTKWRAWHYKLGLRRLEIWAHPADFAAIRDFARAKLLERGVVQPTVSSQSGDDDGG